MMRRFIGGSLDGQEREALGVAYLQPFDDKESSAGWHEWWGTHGVAWTTYNSEHLYRDCPIPGPPSDPCEVYVADKVDGEYVWRFVEVRR
jgi:hypothetical protein